MGSPPTFYTARNGVREERRTPSFDQARTFRNHVANLFERLQADSATPAHAPADAPA